MKKNTLANTLVLGTLLAAGVVIGTAVAQDTAAPAAQTEQPIVTAQAQPQESTAKEQPVKVEGSAAPGAPDASASATPPTTPAAPASPAPVKDDKKESPTDGHK